MPIVRIRRFPTLCACIAAASACGAAPGTDSQRHSQQLRHLDATLPAAQSRITITGTRLTRGNAVDCPTLRGDDGRIHSVSHLHSSIAIGDRVSVTGHYAVTVRCVGEVLFVEEFSILDDAQISP